MKWIKRLVRKLFCKNELSKGDMLILWKDIDNEICGWSGSAESDHLLQVVRILVKHKKVEKLEQITGMNKKISKGI